MGYKSNNLNKAWGTIENSRPKIEAAQKGELKYVVDVSKTPGQKCRHKKLSRNEDKHIERNLIGKIIYTYKVWHMVNVKIGTWTLKNVQYMFSRNNKYVSTFNWHSKLDTLK